jgi:RNA polymerase sigma-70 factor (ECF subfamily)
MTDENLNIDEERLIANVRADMREFKALYLKYVQPVFRYHLNRIGSRTEAEDATAQTFLSALEGFARYRHEGHFAAWLFSIARHKAVDHFRSNGRFTDLKDTTPSADVDLLQQSVHNDQLAAVMHQVRDLPAEEQELLRLRYAAELSHAEIGKLLHLSQDAVKKRIYRTLERLQVQLEETNE